MGRSLITRLRRSKDARSAGRALAFLFVLTGLIGAFTSGAAALPSPDTTIVTCLGFAPSGDDSGGPALSCCTLGCPMVTAAMPAPAAGGLPLPAAAGFYGVGGPGTLVAPPPILASGESPRGPPAAF